MSTMLTLLFPLIYPPHPLRVAKKTFIYRDSLLKIILVVTVTGYGGGYTQYSICNMLKLNFVPKFEPSQYLGCLYMVYHT